MTNSKKSDHRTEARARALRGRLAKVRQARTYRVTDGVPKGLRGEILSAWRSSGMPMDKFGALVGVSGASVANWVRELRGRANRKASARPRTKKGGFREVRVTPEKKGETERLFTVEMGSGARVTGLSLSDVARLMGNAGSAA